MNGYPNGMEYHWNDEYRKTLDKFQETFTFLKITDYSISTYGHSYINWQFDLDMCYRISNDNEAKFVNDVSGTRLLSFFNGWLNSIGFDAKKFYYNDNFSRYSKIQKDFECCLTGTCFDYDILKPILNLWKE